MIEINTVVVGGGQAGLSTSYYLKENGTEHVILERADKPAYAWREQKWDSFCFVIPNWTIRLPGGRFDEFNIEPDEFISREDLINYFEEYIAKNKFPIHFSTEVKEIIPHEGNWKIKTSNEEYLCKNVVVATGFFQFPKPTPFKEKIDSSILQLHTSEYKNLQQLLPGNVLVVGTGQSGMQIAEEIYQSGIKTYICVGSTLRIPRRYRGKDILFWLYESGFYDKTVDKLESPRDRLSSNPHLSGKNGGHTTNLHRFANDGVTLLGRLDSVDGFDLTFKPDLHQSLKRLDDTEPQLLAMLDKHIDSNVDKYGEVPSETIKIRDEGYKQPQIERLNFKQENITNIIWANGYSRDYSMIKTNGNLVDDMGFPIQKRGVSEYLGLYFIGFPWIHTLPSSLLYGVGDDAKYMVEHIVSSNRNTM